MRLLFAFDVETFSAISLKKYGAYLYARHPATDVRCVSYCLVENGRRGPVKIWLPGDPPPAELVEIEQDTHAGTLTFHDAFDRPIHQVILAPRYGWPFIPLERRYCAQAAALARALPASLDAAAAVLKIATRKSKEGVAVMKRLAGPRRQSAKERKAGKPLDFTATPEELQILTGYACGDVTMMLDVVDRVGLLTPAEQAIWLLDQQINECGVHMDITFLETALLLEQAAKRENCAQIAELTSGAVTTPGQRERILAWLNEQGCKIGNLRKATVTEALLDPGLSEPARQLLQLRQDGAGSAALKFSTLRRWTCDDGEPRIYGAYRYHGSSSGRFTSIGVQLHNLRKPELADVAGAIAAVATGSVSELRQRGFSRPLETVGHVTRAAVVAGSARHLFIADLSGIESRGAARIVGAITQLEQWRGFDRTGKPEDEPYYLTGISTFGQPPESARKAGKTGELAFQYQGGIGAYRKITGDQKTSDEVIAARRDAWRRDRPEYVQFWSLATFQAVQAIRHPGMEFACRGIAFQYSHKSGFLEVTLPSGRRLSYPQAELIEDEQYGRVSFTFLDASGSAAGRMYHERRGSAVFGGLLLENITQGFCRDLFVAVMPRLEAAGYPIVMHTHDEWVCEVPDGHGSLEEFLTIVSTPPSWAPDLPIAAKARTSDRLIEIPEPAQAVTIVHDNAIANTVADLQEDEPSGEYEDENGAEDNSDNVDRDDVLSTNIAGEIPPAQQVHVCAHCRHEPDGTEQPSAYEDAWLHPGCLDAFIRAKMAEQGIACSASAPKPEMLKPDGRACDGADTPSAASVDGNDSAANAHSANSNGANASDGLDGFDIAEFLPSHAIVRSAQSQSDYPYGENAAPSAGSATAEYIYKNAQGRLYMRVVRTAGKSFPTYHWLGGEWALGWPKEVVPYRLPELLAAPADPPVNHLRGREGLRYRRPLWLRRHLQSGRGRQMATGADAILQRQAAHLHYGGQRCGGCETYGGDFAGLAWRGAEHRHSALSRTQTRRRLD
jgi:DNA polymerase